MSQKKHTGFVLDALDQALHERRPLRRGDLVHHSDRGSQYVSIHDTERLAEADIEPSVGSVGDSYDNALAESINGLYKAEVIYRRGPWRSLEAVEFATLGGLVQRSTFVGAHRRYPACRGQSALLYRPGEPAPGWVTQIKQPPANPRQFSEPNFMVAKRKCL